MKKITHLLILLVPLFSCNQKDNAGDNNAANNKKNLANEQRVVEFYQTILNNHNPALIDSFCTADFVDHQPFPGYKGDLAGLKQGMTDMMSAFPDMSCTVDMINSWGDTVFVKFRMKGTNSGSLMGAPATNKSMDIEGVDILVLKDGKAREHWGYSEESKMMGQLGMGSPEAGKEPSEKGNN